MNIVGVELGQRNGDKGSQDQFRIRDRAAALCQDFTVEERQIDVNRPRCILVARIANTAQSAFNRWYDIDAQLTGREMRLQ